MKLLIPLLAFSSMDAVAESSSSPPSEPAAVVLLVLGMAALLLGSRSIRQLRHKRMLPPREWENRERSASDKD